MYMDHLINLNDNNNLNYLNSGKIYLLAVTK